MSPPSVLRTGPAPREGHGSDADAATPIRDTLLSDLLDIIGDSVISVDHGQRIVFFNRESERVFGFTAAEVLGEPLEMLLPETARSRHQAQVEGFQSSESSRRLMGERGIIHGRRKSGDIFPAEVSITRSTLNGATLLTAVLRDISQRDRMEHELQDARIASSAKGMFIANMSHELRTPLNAIIGFSDLFLQESSGPLGKPQYMDYAQSINDSGRHLLNVVNNILDISAIEFHKLTLAEEPVLLNYLIRSCLKFIRLAAEAKYIDVDEDIAPDLPVVMADETRLKQAIINLLSNAVKFTPVHGRIKVTAARTEAGTISIAVSDTGIGIPEVDLPNITQPFYPADPSFRRNFGGAGLGLSLVKALMELHGGSLILESKLGEGTTARLILPALRVVA